MISGMIVFKLERERPASAQGASNQLYYVRGRELFLHDYGRATGGVDVPIASLRRVGQQAQTDGIGSAPRYLAYNQHNPTEGNILVCSDIDGGSYELITFSLTNASGSVTDGKRGSCLGPAVFLGRNRFAVLDRHQRQIVIKNLNNETTKRVQPPVPNVDALLEGGASGRVLLRAEDRAILFKVQYNLDACSERLRHPRSSQSYGVLMVQKWLFFTSMVLFVIAVRQLEQLCSIAENVRSKSGCWHVNPTSDTALNLFLYLVLHFAPFHHFKYCLPSGLTRTIRTLNAPLYAMRAFKDQLFCSGSSHFDQYASSRLWRIKRYV